MAAVAVLAWGLSLRFIAARQVRVLTTVGLPSAAEAPLQRGELAESANCRLMHRNQGYARLAMICSVASFARRPSFLARFRKAFAQIISIHNRYKVDRGVHIQEERFDNLYNL